MANHFLVISVWTKVVLFDRNYFLFDLLELVAINDCWGIPVSKYVYKSRNVVNNFNTVQNI